MARLSVSISVKGGLGNVSNNQSRIDACTSAWVWALRVQCPMGAKVRFLHLLGNPVVQVEPRDAELLAAVLLDELDRGLVFLGPFEVIAGDVGPENATRVP
jgi:hypothetical protein